ncbi:sensor domain-containing diguanylate cyclase [Paenibacillus radicis (ex Xue et al. 2023)]|uniref:Sensor domain-containing diguanylate cyclase n=1 Tax=Paenibacillus radicis (ex Xue et al. 2023) TaxID=2972489 RepID=A0ABT1YDC6_9BACL|nr:sensor domain-containing diguanylate cyclase [Paenibacillus radicis (ex Xue et al. 2023)]MCR8631193.1 sensor domain-containing diguanylate cyclase [Paenibacillus radicis (ex Xue et al. 2023)]
MRGQFRRLRLIYLITGLVFLSILGTSIVQIMAAYKAEKASLYETTLALNYESAQKMSVTMNTLFKSMKHSLSVMSEHIAKQGNADASLQKDLDLFLKSTNYFNSVFFVNKDSTVQNVSPASLGATTPKLTSEASLRALELRQPTISPPFTTSTNKLIIFMTHPVYSSLGEYIGYVGGTIYLQENNILNSIFGSFTASQSYAYVVDGEGTLLYHPDKTRLGENVLSNPIVKKLTDGYKGHEEVVNTQGASFLAGYADSSENEWGIVVQTPIEVVTAESEIMIKNVVLISLPLFLVILLVTLWLGKMLAAPFSSLAETAQKLVSGSRVSDLPKAVHWNYEAYHLNETILLTMDTLQQRVDNFSHEAQTDPLTGLSNRRTMDACLADWTGQNRLFSVIALDIDHFKAVNDTYGHQTGDEVLKYLAAVVLSVTRKEDYCCRFGGEEFVVLLPDLSIEHAYKTAETLRKKLENQSSPTGKPITVSLGIASYPHHASLDQPVIQCADQALYIAKRNGRNQTVAYKAKAV